MQYFHHRRKNNFLPLVVFIGSIAAIISSFFIFKIFFTEDEGLLQKAHLNTFNSSRAEVRLSDSGSWNEVFDVFIQEGDSIKAKKGDGVQITFFEDSVISLEEESILKIDKIREFEGGASLVEINLEKGRIWADVSRKINPRCKFIIHSKNTNLTAESQDASFSFAENEIVQTKGDKVIVTIESLIDQKASFFEIIRTGQMITFTNEDFEKITLGEKSTAEIKIISNDFRLGDWFSKHAPSEALLANNQDENSENSTSEDNEDLLTETEEETENEVLQSSANDEDNENNDISEEIEEIEEIKGSFAITSPVIAEEEELETDQEEILVKGTAPSNASYIVIDNFTLTKFKKGDLTWQYKIAEKFGNRISKEFKGKALDENKKVIATDTIKIKFLPIKKPVSGEAVRS